MEAEPEVVQQPEEKIEHPESADLVVAILTELDQDGMRATSDALRTPSGSPRIVMLRDEQAPGSAPATFGAAASSVAPYQMSWPLMKRDASGLPMQSMAAAYQSAFEASEKLNARGCCVVASKIENDDPGWFRQLAEPLLEQDIDLVVPRYAQNKFQGLLNSSIIAPLMRCLYGKRIHNPMGPDLGISRKLYEKMLATVRSSGAAGRSLHPLAAITPAALCENFAVLEVCVGARHYPPTDWTNLSSIVAQVLTPIFLDMERNAACWQRTRASAAVPSIGDPIFLTQDASTLDVTRMVESFQLGLRDLQEIWGLVLPPSTLVELRKLSRLPLEQFRLADELWARIVYDFALGHRLRTINRDHLLKSMTPLYLAWVASYAQDLESARAAALEQRLERLSLAFESGKPYLVSRWRWPDRFNP